MLEGHQNENDKVLHQDAIEALIDKRITLHSGLTVPPTAWGADGIPALVPNTHMLDNAVAGVFVEGGCVVNFFGTVRIEESATDIVTGSLPFLPELTDYPVDPALLSSGYSSHWLIEVAGNTSVPGAVYFHEGDGWFLYLWDTPPTGDLFIHTSNIRYPIAV